MRDIGNNLQRVPVAGDTRAVIIGLHARLVDKVLWGAAAEHDGRGVAAPDHDVRGFDDIRNHVDLTGIRSEHSRLRQPIPIDESAIAGQKIGTLARYAAVKMPSARVSRHR